MASKSTPFRIAGNITLDHTDDVLDCGEILQKANNKLPEVSPEARAAARELMDSLSHLINIHTKRGPITQAGWDRLYSLNRRLADVLVKLRVTALDAWWIARAIRAESACLISRVWLDNLQRAVKDLKSVVEGERDRRGCKQDCMEVILDAGRRLKTKEVFLALEKANLIHGKSTIKGALASLVDDGILTNDGGRKSRGYGVPGMD